MFEREPWTAVNITRFPATETKFHIAKRPEIIVTSGNASEASSSKLIRVELAGDKLTEIDRPDEFAMTTPPVVSYSTITVSRLCTEKRCSKSGVRGGDPIAFSVKHFLLSTSSSA